MKFPRGQIFYDASCGLCTQGRRRFGAMTERRRFTWVPMQEPRAADILGIENGVVPDEVKLLTREGRLLGGVDAFMHVARFVWWAWPVYVVSLVPGVRRLMAVGYRAVARNRQGISASCGFDPSLPPRIKSDGHA